MIANTSQSCLQEEGTVRIAPLLPALDVLARLRINPGSILADCGIPVEQFENPDNPVRFSAACEFLEACARVSGQPHFALRMAESVTPELLGPVGPLMLQHDNVGAALCALVRNLHLHDQGAVPLLHLDDGDALLGYVVAGYHACGTATALDFAMGVALGLMRALTSRQWRPQETWLARRTPENPGPYVEFFGSPVRFDAPYSALIFQEADLRKRIPRSQRRPHRQIDEQQSTDCSAVSASLPFVLQTRRLVTVLLAIQHCSRGEVADLLNLNQRTLNRRLADAGTTFRALADDARFDYARTLLRETDMSLAQVAAAVGYADASTFNRRFRLRASMPPGEWQARLATGT